MTTLRKVLPDGRVVPDREASPGEELLLEIQEDLIRAEISEDARDTDLLSDILYRINQYFLNRGVESGKQ